jgi:hypothetical protein
LKEGHTVEDANEKAKELLQGAEDMKRMKRLSLISFTRASTEHLKANEALAENFKTCLRVMRNRLDKCYARYRGSFANPEAMWFPDSHENEEEVKIDGVTIKYLPFHPSYAREIFCSGGMTILYDSNIILHRANMPRKKMLEACVPALSMGSWFKFVHGGRDYVMNLGRKTEDNLVVSILEAMVKKFGSWSGGSFHRGRPTSVDLLEYYSNPNNVELAVDAMEKFLVLLETSPAFIRERDIPLVI